MYRIFLTPKAIRDLDKIPRDVQKKIAHVFETKFKHDPFSHVLDIKKLQKPEVDYRLRIGEYRVLYSVKKDLITVYKIRHRKDVYR
jgi:mRNA interferase RelE/StbE